MAWLPHMHKNKLWSVLDVLLAGLLIWGGLRWMMAAGTDGLPRFTLGVLGFSIL